MDIEQQIEQVCSRSDFREKMIRFLYGICEIDTSPSPDVALLGRQENLVFDRISDQLNRFSFQQSYVEKKHISPAIEKHPSYSRPYYTASKQHPEELSARQTYHNRYNLLYHVEHPQTGSGRNVALNAHIDVVAPFHPPEIKGAYLCGRGSADDKGNVAVIIGALSVLDELCKNKMVTLQKKITAMFVIEEESGGNGSLDLVLDQNLKDRYDSILILECADNKIFSGNRGAVYFKCTAQLEKPGRDSLKNQSCLAESYVDAILEIDREGFLIREESNHALFPHRPVQTCFGILGPFGKHPSSICGEVTCLIKGAHIERKLDSIKEMFHKGLTAYTSRHGDKTKEKDPETGARRLDKHYDLNLNNEGEIKITVHGLPGHAGSLSQNDAAITKWAFLMKSVLEYKKQRNENFTIALENRTAPDSLILEGSQGFLPTHTMAVIKTRIEAAFSRGMDGCIKNLTEFSDKIDHKVTFDKLHNDAFACDPASPGMKTALQAGIRTGLITKNDPVIGWDVSCDARLFATTFPDLPVITTGVGKLEDAHSDHERVYLPDLFKAISFTSLFLLMETGSLGD